MMGDEVDGRKKNKKNKGRRGLFCICLVIGDQPKVLHGLRTFSLRPLASAVCRAVIKCTSIVTNRLTVGLGAKNSPEGLFQHQKLAVKHTT